MLDEKAGTNSYSATIVGHKGRAILRMGSARDKSVPSGYYHSYEAGLFDIYTTVFVSDNEQIVAEPAKPVKVIENGVLYIEKDGKRYTVQGTLVK